MARKGATKVVRCVQTLSDRMKELIGCNLHNQSFYTVSWKSPFGITGPELLNANECDPKDNAMVMLERAREVITYLQGLHFKVSDSYLGKTVEISTRFNKHKGKLVKGIYKGEMMIMVTLAVLEATDIPELYKEKLYYNIDAWGYTMERIIMKVAKEQGWRLLEGTSQGGGGGKAAEDLEGSAERFVTIYLLLTLSAMRH
jgi:hypothetical protein